MLVRNREKERLTSSMSLEDFAKAMSHLNLSDIPPEKRQRAVINHLLGIQIDVIHDRQRASEILGGMIIKSKLDQ